MKARQKANNSNVMNPVPTRKPATTKPSVTQRTSSPAASDYKQAHYDAISKLSKSDKSEVAAMIKSNNRILQAS